MTPPDRTWSPDLRKLPDEVKLARNATVLGVTPAEFQTLDDATRKWLYESAKPGVDILCFLPCTFRY